MVMLVAPVDVVELVVLLAVALVRPGPAHLKKKRVLIDESNESIHYLYP